MTKHEQNQIENYLEKVLARYQNMESSGVDPLGLKRLTEMCERYIRTGKITPGEFQYLYDRTHPHGKYPNYMNNKRYKKYGEVPQIPNHIFAEYVVDWTIPHDTDFRRQAQRK